MLGTGSSVILCHCLVLQFHWFLFFLSAVCNSLCFCRFWQEDTDLFQIGTCYKSPGIISETVLPYCNVGTVGSWESFSWTLQLCFLGYALALTLAYPPPRFIFDPQGTLILYKCKQVLRSYKRWGKEKNFHNVWARHKFGCILFCKWALYF